MTEDEARALLTAHLRASSPDAVADLRCEQVSYGFRFEWDHSKGAVPFGQTSWVVLNDGTVHARRRTETPEQLLVRVQGDQPAD